MNKDNSEPSPSQFSIKRLFWMTIVVAIFLAIANQLGLRHVLSFCNDRFQQAGTSHKISILAVGGVFLALVIVYLHWISFRLPLIWLSIRRSFKESKRRRAELEAKYVRRDSQDKEP